MKSNLFLEVLKLIKLTCAALYRGPFQMFFFFLMALQTYCIQQYDKLFPINYIVW